MGYKIRYLPLAVQDIDVLAAYLMQFYPNTAGRMLQKMEHQINLLRDTPEMCEVYSSDPFYRRMVCSGYLVFYHIDEAQQVVDIHRVLRGSWDMCPSRFRGQ